MDSRFMFYEKNLWTIPSYFACTITFENKPKIDDSFNCSFWLFCIRWIGASLNEPTHYLFDEHWIQLNMEALELAFDPIAIKSWWSGSMKNFGVFETWP